MKKPEMGTPAKYTCTEYRQEMMLLALQLRLSKENLPEAEKEALREEIRRLEQAMNMA